MILVAGATGKVGGALVDLLAERVRRVAYLSATAAADGPGRSAPATWCAGRSPMPRAR